MRSRFEQLLVEEERNFVEMSSNLHRNYLMYVYISTDRENARCGDLALKEKIQ